MIFPANPKGECMPVSSILCHAQEAEQRQRAEDSAFENVRAVAAKAAAAWHKEGIAADAREARQLRVRAYKADAAAAGRVDDDLRLSENPDRGRADQLEAVRASGRLE